MSKKNINLNLQSLKGIAACMVMFGHILMFNKNTIFVKLAQTPFHFFFDGQCAVVFFFVLSGFFYYKQDLLLTPHDYILCIKKKFQRLYPIYALCITACYFLYFFHNDLNIDNCADWTIGFWSKEIKFTDYIREMLLSPIPSQDRILPVGWFMVCEFTMVFIMPLVVHISNKVGLPFLLLSFIVCFNYIDCYYSFYILGALVHSLVLTENCKHYNSSFLYVCFVVIALLLLNIVNEFDLHSKKALLFQSLGAGILIFTFSGVPFPSIKIDNAYLVGLGNKSYGLYMGHFFPLFILWQLNLPVYWFVFFGIVSGFIMSELLFKIDVKIQHLINSV